MPLHLEFLPEEHARRLPFTAEYCYSTASAQAALIILLAMAVTCAVGALKVWAAGSWLGAAFLGWCALWLGLFAFIARLVSRARRRPTNWLVRVKTDGLLIHYRSYMNHHFRADHQTVAFIPFSEIEWARAHRVQRNLPGTAQGEDTVRAYRYVELKIGSEAAEEFAEQIQMERGRSGPERPTRFGRARTKSPHYPVQIARGDIVRVEWGVRPTEADLLEKIEGFVTIRPSLGSSVDFRRIDELAPPEQERHVLELIETGDRLNAITVVKRLYKLNTTQAALRVKELEGRKR